MFKLFLKKTELDRLQPLLNYLQNINPKQVVVEEKKKNYTWLIIVASIVGLAAVGFIVYKMFFEISDDFEDFDDEDFEDIDFDEDYDEEFDAFEETVEKVSEELE